MMACLQATTAIRGHETKHRPEFPHMGQSIWSAWPIDYCVAVWEPEDLKRSNACFLVWNCTIQDTDPAQNTINTYGTAGYVWSRLYRSWPVPCVELFAHRHMLLLVSFVVQEECHDMYYTLYAKNRPSLAGRNYGIAVVACVCCRDFLLSKRRKKLG